MVIKRAERDAKKKVKGNRAHEDTRNEKCARKGQAAREGHKGEKIERYTKDEPRDGRGVPAERTKRISTRTCGGRRTNG